MFLYCRRARRDGVDQGHVSSCVINRAPGFKTQYSFLALTVYTVFLLLKNMLVLLNLYILLEVCIDSTLRSARKFKNKIQDILIFNSPQAIVL